MKNVAPAHLAVRSALLVALLMGAVSPHAQQTADPAQVQQALARAQGLLRQLGQQKQQLEIDNARLKAELAAADKRLRKAELDLGEQESALAAAEGSTKRTASELERTRKRLDQTNAKLAEVIARYKDTARTLKQTQFEQEHLELELANTQQALAAAEASNLALYTDNRAILDLYRQKSGWTSFLQHEPVTGLKGVEIENLIEEYEYKMYDHVLEQNLDAVQGVEEPAQAPAP
jgi:chromosome segregation ATPase